MSVQKEPRAAVSITEMARLVGLSRSRFYQLIGSAFPQPERHPQNGRPIYTEALQQVCLEVRQSHRGIDGQPVLFQGRCPSTAPARPKKVKGIAAPKEDHADLLDGLRSLGLTSTAADVAATVKELYPQGVEGIDQGEVLRAVFLRLKK